MVCDSMMCDSLPSKYILMCELFQFILTNVPIVIVCAGGATSPATFDVRKIDEFCIRNREYCYRNDESCIKNDAFSLG